MSAFFPEVYPQGEERLRDTEPLPDRGWCPECQSPPSDDFAHIQYCQQHPRVTLGTADHIVDSSTYIVNSEAGGEDNRNACEFFHRDRRKESA